MRHISQILKELKFEFMLRKRLWVKADGTVVPVCCMTPSHIRNTIACLKGDGFSQIPDSYLGGKEKWIAVLEEELRQRQ